MGRPKNDPILPNIVDEEDDKVMIGAKVLYPQEKEILENILLEKKGYSSISEWLYEKVEEEITGNRDLRKKIKELENKKQEIEEKKQKQLEEINEEIEQLKEQLHDRASKLEDVKDILKEKIKQFYEDKKYDIPDKKDYVDFLEDLQKSNSFQFTDIDEARKCMVRGYSPFQKSEISKNEIPDKIISEMEEEQVIDLGGMK